MAREKVTSTARKLESSREEADAAAKSFDEKLQKPEGLATSSK
jgi:hypothetical protein